MDRSGRSPDPPPTDGEVAARVNDQALEADADAATEAALEGLGSAARAGYRWRTAEEPNLGLIEVEVTRAVQEARRAAAADRAETLVGAARRAVEEGLEFWPGEDAHERAATLVEQVDAGGPDAAGSFLLGVALRDSRTVLDKLEGRTGPTGFGGG
jgi:hypothetical protein